MLQWIGSALVQIMACRLVAYWAPRHYLNQCLDLINWTLLYKLQWIFSQKSNFFIQENVFENVVCEMMSILSRGRSVNTVRKEQNGLHLADNIFKWIFLIKNYCILIQSSLKFIPLCPVASKSTLVQIMTWHWTANKPSPDAIMNQFTNAYMGHLATMI